MCAFLLKIPKSKRLLMKTYQSFQGTNSILEAISTTIWCRIPKKYLSTINLLHNVLLILSFQAHHGGCQIKKLSFNLDKILTILFKFTLVNSHSKPNKFCNLLIKPWFSPKQKYKNISWIPCRPVSKSLYNKKWCTKFVNADTCHKQSTSTSNFHLSQSQQFWEKYGDFAQW